MASEAGCLPPAVLLMGPTASGKTHASLELARRLPVGIISVDSAMVYRGLDIGTAKPDAATMAEVPHALIDIRDPADPYSAAAFRADALREMQRITNVGRVPVLVGGTMLYFRALQSGLSPLPAADTRTRERLAAQAEALGWPAMHAWLADIDPEAAARIHANDPQRIQRALEVYLLTGQPMSRLQRGGDAAAPGYRMLKLALYPGERAALHRRIETRFRQMLAAGFLDEVRGLYRRDDLHVGLPAIRAVGYRQAWAYLAGELDYPSMVEKAVIATRQLAKRQLTWLRREPQVEWWTAADRRGHALVDRTLRFLSANG